MCISDTVLYKNWPDMHDESDMRYMLRKVSYKQCSGTFLMHQGGTKVNCELQKSSSWCIVFDFDIN